MDTFRIFEKTVATWVGVVKDEAGAVQDITGWAIEFDLVDTTKSGTDRLLKRWSTDAAEIILSDPTNGEFTLGIGDTDVSVTADLLHGLYEIAFYSSGSTSNPVTGRFQGQAAVVEVENE